MRADNRAALLRGARACLDERGYARTRARHVADAAGVSTAAIGYHFGTTDALLVEALMQGMEEWSAHLGDRLRSVPERPRRDRLAAVWGAVVESFHGYRGVLAASFELMARADEESEIRDRLRPTIEQARRGAALQILGIDPQHDPDRAHRAGAACYALLSGLIVQWLVDPDSVPSGTDLADGLIDTIGD
ncbi:helix-turn-helix domain containing protein [Nocardiopsis sp. RSe5-2]|uniref:Helix-turn-helix domain containing protein n=1 Tax=Nocardiopsis endophytica TaxID=3018445 RepID=A0ABT4TXN1_9ACTN|nr:TetR/AcrR family transcriptional regulator [Nocardiopsis endophytica]MDA2809015.1 helix-turn-helix domain containing protein [Nocardiopsis endophytica]